MSATDLAAVLVVVVAVAVTGVAVVMVMQLRRTTDELREVLGRLRGDVDATMQRLDDQADAIESEMARVDGLVASAERVSARADTLSRVTYGAVAKPVIKTAAVVKGTSKAARRLTGRHDADEAAS